MKLQELDRAMLAKNFSPSGSASKRYIAKKQLSFHSPVLPRSPLTLPKHPGGLLELLPEEKGRTISATKASPRTPPSPTDRKNSRRVSINTINAQFSIARVQERVASSFKDRCKRLEVGNAELLESVEDLQATIASLQRSKQRYQAQTDQSERINNRFKSNWKLVDAQFTSCLDVWQRISGREDKELSEFDTQITHLQRTWKDCTESNESVETEPLVESLCEVMSKLVVGKESPSKMDSSQTLELKDDLILTKDILQKSKDHIFALENELKKASEEKQKLKVLASEQMSDLKCQLDDLKKDFRAEFSSSAVDFNNWSGELMQRIASQEKDRAHLVSKFKKEESRRKQLLNTVHNLKGNIRVMCRVRPILSSDEEKPDSICAVETVSEEKLHLTTNSTNATGTNKIKTSEFEFDRVFGANSKQGEVFDEVQPLVESVMDGFQACIFAYGQTGSGKTYTMSGSSDTEGINYLALRDLFELRDQRETGGMRYTFTVRNVEIYCEKIIDLLATPNEKDSSSEDLGEQVFVDVRYNDRDGVHMPGVVEEKVNTVDEVVHVMELGARNRTSSHTKMNLESSRSHSVVMISVHGENTQTGKSTSGRLVLVDLAGSERLNKSGVVGAQLKEAQSINKSLSCLGDVIAALESKAAHIPFRNSKLTMLLQDSLGKDNKALMILQVSPTLYNAQETLCSLNFAARVRSCELGKAKKNEKTGENPAQKALRKELQEKLDGLETETRLLKKQLTKVKSESESIAETKVTDIEKLRTRLREKYDNLSRNDQLEIKGLKEKLQNRDASDKGTTTRLENELHGARTEINNLRQQLRSALSASTGFSNTVSSQASPVIARISKTTRASPRRPSSEAVLQERRASLDNVTPEKGSKKQVSWKNTPLFIAASPGRVQQAEENLSPNGMQKPSRANAKSVLGNATRILQTPGKAKKTTSVKALRVPTSTKSRSSSRSKWV